MGAKFAHVLLEHPLPHVNLFVLQVPGYLLGAVVPAVHGQPPLWQLLWPQLLHHRVPHLLHGRGDRVLVLVLLHQVFTRRLSCL